MVKKPCEFKKISISDHAVMRYRERTGSTDCDAVIRETIATLFFYSAVNVWYRYDKKRRLSDRHYKCGSLTFVVIKGVVATIYPFEKDKFSWKGDDEQKVLYSDKRDIEVKSSFYDSISHTAYQKIKKTKKRKRTSQRKMTCRC